MCLPIACLVPYIQWFQLFVWFDMNFLQVELLNQFKNLIIGHAYLLQTKFWMILDLFG